MMSNSRYFKGVGMGGNVPSLSNLSLGSILFVDCPELAVVSMIIATTPEMNMELAEIYHGDHKEKLVKGFN
jgi:hypothetical protein